MLRALTICVIALPLALSAFGQQPMESMPDMPGMHHHHASTFIDALMERTTGGTAAQPVSTPEHMLMIQRRGWTLMLHGVAFLTEQQQSGPRGAGKLFSTDWLMPMAQHNLGAGKVTLRTMLSLDPATVTRGRYPELFQVGETAYGKPIVDGQHPHDFFMELAAIYDRKLGDNTLLSFYAAPVGDPAMGPLAYPHRPSASENPLAPLGHHLEDSTHISDDVVTVGLTYRKLRVEASGFHGREPDEFRWDIDQGRIDSWATRLTLNPSRNWSAQYSAGYLTSPEELQPGEDLLRMTASLMYNRPLHRGNWASTLVWGRNSAQTGNHLVSNGYLAESTLRFLDRNYVWERIENVDRTNELQLAGLPQPPGFEERPLGRIQAYTGGYEREFRVIPWLSTGLGGQVTVYTAPDAVNAIYGAQPVGVALFLRVRLRE